MGQRTFEDAYADQKKTPPPVAHADLTGKTVLVTGANIGLGFEACKHFARMNPARLILACRNVDKGNAALSQLQTDTGYAGGEVWQVDLGSFASVSAFADKTERELDRLDILVENAAAVNWGAFQYTEDGWETVLQTNYISTALLALRLFPILKKTAGLPRVVIVTSEMIHYVDVPQQFLDAPNILEAMNRPEKQAEVAGAPDMKTLAGGYSHTNDAGNHEDGGAPDIADRYSHTKLLELFFTRSLQSHCAGSVIVNCVNPGFCVSNLRSTLPAHMRAQNAQMEADMAFTTEEGSRQLVFGAVGGAGEEEQLRGAYIFLSEVCEVSDYALSEKGREVEERIWKETLALLRTVDPKVGDIDTKMTGSL